MPHGRVGRQSAGQQRPAAQNRPPVQGRPADPQRSRAGGLPLSRLLSVDDETDEHGRLLLEDSAPKRAIKQTARAGIPMQTKACPYRDTPSRHGGDMNISAYEALRRDTTEVLNGLAWLHRQYVEQEPGTRGTVQALTDISKLGVTLPLVMFHRARDPVSPYGQLASFIAAIFKACRGMYFSGFDLRADGDNPRAEVSAPEVVAFADDSGHFKRPQTGTVCAAPTRLIERTVAVVLTGTGADPQASSLGKHLTFDMLWDFFRLERAFNDNLSRYGYVLEQLWQRGKTTDSSDLFDQTITVSGNRGRFGDFTEAFLDYANNAQALLNRTLGRAENAPPLTFQDIVRAL